MEKGLFRKTDGEVQVDYDGVAIPIPRAKYEENRYQPAFDSLPPEGDYLAFKKVKSWPGLEAFLRPNERRRISEIKEW